MTTFGFRQRIMIGTWNVRTLSETSRLLQVCNEMSSYSIDILGISEARWVGSGKQHLQSGHCFIFSGNDTSKINGVGIVMSNKAKRTLLEYKAVSDRIITARFNTKFRKMTVVQCYAPTEPDDDANKDSFYLQLDAVISSIPRGDIKIIIGDLNAKTGCDNSNLQSIMGKHGLGSARNNNGDRLIDFCARHRLFIGGTKFPHKNIHKYTWESPDGRTKNQIDHVIINKQFLGCLLDVKARRGADIDSDHVLLVGAFRLRPAAPKKKSAMEKYNINRLKDPTVATCYSNSIHHQLNSSTRSENTWNDVVLACNQSAKTVLGLKPNIRKPWVTENTWIEICNRKRLKNALLHARSETAKLNARIDYRQSAGKVKCMVRNDRKIYLDSLAAEAEKASSNGNMRGVHEAINQLRGSRIRNTAVIKDHDGRELTSSEDQLRRWRDFFSCSTSHSTNIDISTCAWLSRRRNPCRSIPTAPPSRQEIIDTLRRLKNNKSAGPDQIAAELMKYGAEPIADALMPILNHIWETNTIPNDWKKGTVVTIPKKGDLSLCRNWRGITLLNTVNKVLALLILDRITPYAETILRKEQAGFRPNRSCSDHTTTLRILIEQSLEYNSSLYLLFVDFERAFDTVSRDAIWASLYCKGFPEKIINIIRELYNNAACSVRYNGNESLPFTTNAGVRQGCTLSPTLFLILLDGVMEQTNIDSPSGIRWNLSERLNDIDYADDICLIAHRHTDIQDKLSHLARNAAKVGLKININKTKLMRIGPANAHPLNLDGVTIDEVDSFCYLGSTMTADGRSDKDITDRINKARSAFQSLYKIWRANNISKATKMRIFNSSVTNVLLYGCTTWSLTQTNIRKLQTFTNRCLRQILRIFWPQWVTNEQLLELANLNTIECEIKKRKWSWIGHTLRKPPQEISRVALEWNPQGQRRPGRPRSTWIRTMRREYEDLGMTWNQVKSLANHRDRWREFISALSSH